MLNSLRAKLNKKWFDINASAVLETGQVECDPNSNVLVLSQLYPPDLIMYMLAAKSFSRFLKPREFVIVDDKLSAKDKELLGKHFEQIRFVPITSIAAEGCPKGACWERLLSIADLNQGNYVIQLDADTLTLAPPNEVLQCVTENRSFTLGTSSGKEITSLHQASQFAAQHLNEHVQLQAEAALERYPNAEQLHYVRGCAGFAGFATGYLTREKVQTFSSNMATLIGMEKWKRWGSEQVASNFLIANSRGAKILPLERFPFWAPGVAAEKASLIHFVGTQRYHAGKYARLAKAIISELS